MNLRPLTTLPYYGFPRESTQQKAQKTRLLRHRRYFSGEVLSGIRAGVRAGEKAEAMGGKKQNPAQGELLPSLQAPRKLLTPLANFCQSCRDRRKQELGRL